MFFSSLTKAVRAIAALMAVGSVAGCSVPFPVYSPAGKNVQVIRSIPSAVEVGQVTGTQTSVSCRLQPIGPENGQTFAAYIAKALNEEILIAGGDKRDTKIHLSGTLKSIEVDCGILAGSWTVEMDVSVNNQPPFSVKTVHAFDGNYLGQVVFTRAHTAFVPTIQDLIGDIINSPEFQSAVKKQ